MDFIKTIEEKTRQEMHKNSMCCSEKILEATPHKTATVLAHLKKHPCMMNKTCLISKEKLISDVLLWAFTHGHTCVGRSAKTQSLILCGDSVQSRGPAEYDGQKEQMTRVNGENPCNQYNNNGDGY